MKKIFTLILSMLSAVSIFAAAEFFVKINNNGNYTVSLNNQSITSTSNIFRFFDLYNGNYNLAVYENGYNGRMIFNQQISISNGYRTVAELDKFYGLRIIDKIPFIQKSWYIDVLQQTQTQYPPVCNIPVPTCPPKPWHGGNGNTYPNNYPNSYPNTYPNNYPNNGGNYGGYGNYMDDASLQSLLQTMKNAMFEEKMIEIARTGLKNRLIKTNQVHQILELFSFDKNKLEAAKLCYDKTIDKNNYYTLYNDFTFNNYSTQLDKYINNR